MKKWKCSVCGYVHTGAEPPEKCPVCGAGRDKFVELTEEEAIAAEAEFRARFKGKFPPGAQPGGEAGEEGKAGAKKSSSLYGFISGQMVKHHAHPVSVHTPNGVLPAAVLFLLLSLIFNISCLAEATFYSLVFVVLAMPLVLFSGYIDWKARFGGVLTSVILTKMICGVLVFSIGLGLVIWRVAVPAVADPTSASRGVYLLVHLAMLAAAGLAGFLGGKLVFGE